MNSGAWTRTEASYEPWWWAHIPRAPGINADGKQNNWLKYFADLHNYNMDGSPKPFRAALYAVDRYNGGAGGHRFQVAYSSPFGIRRDSLNGSDLVVQGPNGYQASPTLVEVSDSRDGTYLVATYELPAPGGGWDAADLGEYQVRIVAGEVFDRLNSPLAAAPLGVFFFRDQVGVGPEVDNDTTFLLRFDGNRTTVDGESPIESSGGTFVPGISGQALHLGDNEYLRFATAGNISPSEGTLEFWVKPDWPGNNPGPQNHVFFSTGNYPHNLMSVLNDNWNNVFWFLTHGDNPRTPELETTSGESLRTSMSTWEADVWRHVAVTWRNSGINLEMYFDGVLVGTQNLGIRIPVFLTDNFFLGTEWSKVFSANAALDEFRISSQARSAAEINATYRATLGLTTLAIDGAEAAIGLGETRRLIGVASGDTGTELRIAGRQIAWNSTQPGIATVDADGTVRGVGVGMATIIGTLGDLQAEVMVTVVDPGRPTAVAAGLANITVAGAAPLDFTVTYADSDGIDNDSIDFGDILVRGPNGYAAFASRLTVAGEGNEVTATYRITPPSGLWRVADNGDYVIELVANQVRDGIALPALGQRLGQFQVAIAPAVTHIADFAFGASPQVRLYFSADVGASLSASDFTVVALPGSTVVPSDRVSLTYDAVTRSAVVTLNAVAPGTYRLTLPRTAATDRAGVPLATDASTEFQAESDLLPPPPSDIATTAGNRAVRLSWTAPTWGGPPITDYVVQVRFDGRPWSTLTDGVSAKTTATAVNLLLGKSYFFRIASVNATGTGQFSVETAAAVPIAVPDVVRSIVGTRGNGFVQLRWQAPSVVGDGPVTNYRVQYSADAGQTWTTFTRSASRATSVAVTGLSNGVSYLFRVAAINRLGMGFDALGPNAITPATTPFAPTGVTAAVSGSTISLNWTAPESNGGSPIVNYTVYYRNTRTTKWSILSRPASTATSAVARLSRNASYVFRVAAINGVGASPFSGISNVATL